MKTHLPHTPAPLPDSIPARADSRPAPCAWRLLAAIALAALTLHASAQETPTAPAPAPNPSPTNSSEATTATPQPAPESMPDSTTPDPETAPALATQPADNGSNGLRLNFRNAPIDLVLSYLSDAAGFIIELDTSVRGNVSVISSHPMSPDEAVDLLNSVLNKNGYAAIRNGRTLKIMDKNTAKSSHNPVRIGNDPQSIPSNDEMVTQIVPIRYVEATQLATDLAPFVSPQATIIANQAGNSIVITDTQANIRHMVEIIRAIDTSAEDVTELRVFHLEHADPTEMANLLTSLFPDQSNSQLPIRFGGRASGGRTGGRGGFPGFPFPGAFAAAAAANTTGNTQTDRIKKRNQVVAVPDPRTSSVVVTATKDLMDQIAAMVRDLDFKSGKEQSVKVFRLNNADAQQILPVLQDMFQNSTTAGRNARTSTTQNSPLQSRIQQNINNATTTTPRLGTGTSTTGNRNFGGNTGF